MSDVVDPQPPSEDGPPVPGAHDGPVLPERLEDLVEMIPGQLDPEPSSGDIVCVFCRGRRIRRTVLVRPFGDLHGLTEVWQLLAAELTFAMPDIDACVVVAYTGPETTPALQDLATNATLPLFVLRVHEGHVHGFAPGAAATDPAPEPAGPPASPARTADRAGIDHGAAFPETGLEAIATVSPAPVLRPVQQHLHDLSVPILRGRAEALAGITEDWFALVADELERRANGPVPLPAATAAHLLLALQHDDVLHGCLLCSDDRAWWLWSDLLRQAPPGWAAPVATLIAHAAFRRERVILGRAAARRALSDTPRYPIARLLLALSRCLPTAELAACLGKEDPGPEQARRAPVRSRPPDESL
jgi:hypothetical protein